MNVLVRFAFCIHKCSICLWHLRSNERSIARCTAFASVALNFVNAATFCGLTKEVLKSNRSHVQTFLRPSWIVWQPWFMTSPEQQVERAWLDLFGCCHGSATQWCRCFLSVVCRITAAWIGHTCTLQFPHMDSHKQTQEPTHTNLLYLPPTFALIFIKQINNDNALTCSQIQRTKQATESAAPVWKRVNVRISRSAIKTLWIKISLSYANLVHLWWRSIEKRLFVCVPITSLFDTNLGTEEDWLYPSFDTLTLLLEKEKSIFQVLFLSHLPISDPSSNDFNQHLFPSSSLESRLLNITCALFILFFQILQYILSGLLNQQFLSALWSILASFSLLFWFYCPQL